ncbi:MAG: glutamate--tRNA ligase [Bacteroidales bacterium]|nr:glutamate--tRNA ligase [Bacteroidales bacterium]
MKKRRVRFAPSPTGPLHMGGVRTALYNFLYAHQAGGDFILRIEDTDSTRFVPGAEEYIIEALRWCGIYPDEGVDAEGKVVETPSERHPYAPYRQSQRRGIYRKYAEELVEKGCAYYAFDTAEELASLRAAAEAEKRTFTYNQATRGSLRNSLTLPADEVARLLEESTAWTIRFKTPENTVIKMDDLIRGHIEVNSDTLDDKVLWKRADELPTYHLANVVDDHLMEITDVIRGEEWLPSLPLHYLLYDAFGWQDSRPNFAHLSLLLKPDGKGKLSKRDGDRLGFPVFPLKWVNAEGEVSRGYREDGYYPEAFINLLAMLGWNPGTEQELFSLDELVQAFSLDRVVKSGARFNPDKAKWFNQEYLRMRPTEALIADFRALNGEKVAAFSDAYIGQVLEMMKERAHFANELWDLTAFFFEAPQTYDEASVAKFWKDEVKEIIPKVREAVKAIEPFDKETIETALHDLITSNEWPMGKVMNTLRLFLVGVSKGPGIADMMAIFGKEETLRRIDVAIAKLG